MRRILNTLWTWVCYPFRALSNWLSPDFSVENDTLVLVNKRAINEYGQCEIPNCTSIIGFFAFRNCTNLVKEISFPVGLREIGGLAFGSCHEIEIISLPKSVESIAGLAFHRCSKLEIIYLPEGVVIEGNAFSDCGALKHIYVATHDDEVLERIRQPLPDDQKDLVQVAPIRAVKSATKRGQDRTQVAPDFYSTRTNLNECTDSFFLASKRASSPGGSNRHGSEDPKRPAPSPD